MKAKGKQQKRKTGWILVLHVITSINQPIQNYIQNMKRLSGCLSICKNHPKNGNWNKKSCLKNHFLMATMHNQSYYLIIF